MESEGRDDMSNATETRTIARYAAKIQATRTQDALTAISWKIGDLKSLSDAGEQVLRAMVTEQRVWISEGIQHRANRIERPELTVAQAQYAKEIALMCGR